MTDDVDSIIEELIIFLGGECALCEKPFPDKKTWTVHHRKYLKGWKKYKDFIEKIPHIVTRGKNKGKKTTKKIYHKQEYYEYLRPLVYKHPKLFRAMHHYCHVSLGYGTKWGKKNGNRKRYCKLIMELD
jgi:hypothetical protein